MPLRRLHRSMTPTSSRSLVTKPGEAVGVMGGGVGGVGQVVWGGGAGKGGGGGGGGS